MSGVCKTEKDNTVLIFSSGPEIRAFDLKMNDEFTVIGSEKRIEAIDYNPETQLVFWADSYDKTIKRSYMVNAMNGNYNLTF